MHCETQTINERIVVPTTIALSKECWFRALSTTEETHVTDVTKLKCINIKKYDIYKCTDSVEKKNERNEKLIEIAESTTPSREHNALIPMCVEYSDIFRLKGEKPKVNNFYSQSVKLSDTTPVFTPNYRLTQPQKTIISGEVSRLLADDPIEMCASNFNSPLPIEPEKSTDGTSKFRRRVDYRKLNRKLIHDRFQKPRIEVIFENLESSKYFSTMDLQAGYHQIPIAKESRKYLAFNSDKGMYR